MRDIQKRIIEDACASWEVGNARAAMESFHDKVVFTAPAPGASVMGSGQGKEELVRRLTGYLEKIEVRYYEVLRIAVRRESIYSSRVRFIYRHRREPYEIEGIMSHEWHFAGEQVVRFRIFYDALRMRAFYDLLSS